MAICLTQGELLFVCFKLKLAAFSEELAALKDELAALKAQLQVQGFPHVSDMFGDLVFWCNFCPRQDRDAEIARLKELLPAGSAAAVAHASAWRPTSPDV